MSIRACSHLVIATDNVSRIGRFFSGLFEIQPHFENADFAEFVLLSRFRIAFFRPVGKSSRSFDADAPRGGAAFGVTVADVDALYARFTENILGSLGGSTLGPPKTHPWGEKSFLLIDPDGNRWEITQSPSPDGMLVPRN